MVVCRNERSAFLETLGSPCGSGSCWGSLLHHILILPGCSVLSASTFKEWLMFLPLLWKRSLCKSLRPAIANWWPADRRWSVRSERLVITVLDRSRFHSCPQIGQTPCPPFSLLGIRSQVSGVGGSSLRFPRSQVSAPELSKQYLPAKASSWEAWVSPGFSGRKERHFIYSLGVLLGHNDSQL